ERGAAEPADAGNLRAHLPQDLDPFLEIAVSLIRDAGGNQRFGQVTPSGHTQARVLQPGAAALLGPEGVVGDRLVDHARGDLAPALAVQPRLLNRDRDREVRDAVEEVAGSVERVDDEARLGGIA